MVIFHSYVNVYQRVPAFTTASGVTPEIQCHKKCHSLAEQPVTQRQILAVKAVVDQSSPDSLAKSCKLCWLLYGYYMVIIVLLYGYHMVIIWLLYGYNMVIILLLYGYYMVNDNNNLVGG